jgi:hypothetical protein
VVIPEFVQKLGPSFWLDAVEGGKTMPIQLSERMKNEISRYEVQSVANEIVEKFASEWQRIEIRYWEVLGLLIPDRIKWIGSLEIRITKYATQTSYYLLERKNNQHLIIHLREDGDIRQLARIIIVALLWPDRDKFGLTWSKRVAVADFFMLLAPMRKIFEQVRSSLKVKSISPDWLEKSELYIAKLKVPQILQEIDVIRKFIQIFGEKERVILLKIVTAKGEMVTQDEIADLQWGVGEFGSFSAMNKLIQRIRKKLDKIGIDGKRLRVVKGEGYVWR